MSRIICILTTCCFAALAVFTATAHGKVVVIYTSLDQLFSESILREYEKISGVRVRAVCDVEASKTTGLVNRLIAEKNGPNATCFGIPKSDVPSC